MDANWLFENLLCAFDVDRSKYDEWGNEIGKKNEDELLSSLVEEIRDFREEFYWGKKDGR